MTSITVTAETLNDSIDFDCPFTIDNINDETAALSIPGNLHAPDVSLSGNTGAFDISPEGEWRAVTGYSGQHNYSGPIMHPSEFLGGRMAESVIDDSGTYVVVEVRDEDGSYPDEDAIGWMLLVKA